MTIHKRFLPFKYSKTRHGCILKARIVTIRADVGVILAILLDELFECGFRDVADRHIKEGVVLYECDHWN